ncbi:MAG: hypothetical protein QHC65_04125 [Sphingomonas sp.]|nr:hypothetical protein [Sphingomonas sp.]MDX3883585.1 hypothetical protein [Sphingomonas sp.]
MPDQIRLQRMLAFAREHSTSLDREARILGDAVFVPLDYFHAEYGRGTDWEPARSLSELRAVLGY